MDTQNIMWLEVSEIGSGIDFPRDEAGQPVAWHDFDMAMEEHQKELAFHQQRIDEGDKDADDEYEYDLMAVRFEGNVMILLDKDDSFSEIKRFDWRF